MINSYTPEQVLAALKRQNFTDEQANAIYEAMDGERKNSAQLKAGYRAVGAPDAELPSGDDGEMDSSFMPDLVEGTAYAGLGPYAAKKFASQEVPGVLGALKNGGRWLARGGIPMTGAMAATTAAMALTGNRFYDQATPQQTLADMGGSIGGYMAGSALGRAAGATLGSFAGPVGGVLGLALGGWLLPKLLPAGSKSVKKDDGSEPSDKQAWGTLGAMGVAGGLAMNGKSRKIISDIIRRRNQEDLT